MLCGVHGKELRENSRGFYCPTKLQDGSWCKYKPQTQQSQQSPQQGGWNNVRQQVAQKVAPEKAVMTKEDWEAKEQRTNKNILLQVAFKAAVELYAQKTNVDVASNLGNIKTLTLDFHTWLLSHTEGQTKPISQNIAPQTSLGTNTPYTPPQEGEDIPLPEDPWI